MTAWRLPAWVRTEARTIDRVLAVVLFLWGCAELLPRDMGGSPALNVALVAGWSLPLAWRRERPLAVVATAYGSVGVMAIALTDVEPLVSPFLVAMLTAYGAGAYAPGRRALAGLALVVAGMVVVCTTLDPQSVGDYLFPTAFAATAWLAGVIVRRRVQLTEELHEAALRAEEARGEEARRAATDERRRIAREMHDVVAHSVSVMVVQAGGARRILERDPGRAEAAALEIERTGREAMAEMRRLLGVLHPHEDEAAARAPQPTLRELDQLVERSRAAGLPVALRVHGEPRSLPAGVDLAAYRVVQEGLTNALKYAHGAPTEVGLRWGDDALELRVSDTGPGPRERTADGSGHGLVGMQERVRLYGGQVRTGRRVGGGFEIIARLPL